MPEALKRFETYLVKYAAPRPEDLALFAVYSVGHYLAGPDFQFARPNGHKVEHIIYTLRGGAWGGTGF